MSLMAALACPAQAAPVDAEQGNALTPRSSLELKTGDEAAQDAANAAAAAHGITVLPPTANTAPAPRTTSTNTSTPPPAGTPASAAQAPEVDLRRTVRDAAKPVLDDIARSAVGDVVRSVTASDEPINEDAASDEATGRRRNWEGAQGSADADTGRRRTDAEIAKDRVKASFLLQALVQEVAPWALAAAVLYVVFYTARLLFALRRRLKAEKRERRRQHDRRRNTPGTTSRGTPTQR